VTSRVWPSARLRMASITSMTSWPQPFSPRSRIESAWLDVSIGKWLIRSIGQLTGSVKETNTTGRVALKLPRCQWGVKCWCAIGIGQVSGPLSTNGTKTTLSPRLEPSLFPKEGSEQVFVHLKDLAGKPSNHQLLNQDKAQGSAATGFSAHSPAISAQPPPPGVSASGPL
jgi:hypothetical protein